MRNHLIIKSPSKTYLNRVLKFLTKEFESWPETKKVKWSYDLDPYDVLDIYFNYLTWKDRFIFQDYLIHLLIEQSLQILLQFQTKRLLFGFHNLHIKVFQQTCL